MPLDAAPGNPGGMPVPLDSAIPAPIPHEAAAVPAPAPSSMEAPAPPLHGGVPGAPPNDPAFGGTPIPTSTPTGQPVPSNLGPAIGSEDLPTRPSKRKKKKEGGRLRWPGIVIPLLFLVLAAVVVWLVLDLSNMFRSHVPPRLNIPAPGNEDVVGSPNEQARNQARQRSRIDVEPPPSPIAEVGLTTPVRNETPIRDEAAPVEGRSLEDEEGETPLSPHIDLGEQEENAVEEPKPATVVPPAKPAAANDVLGRFLQARTLEERRPFMTRSRRSPDVLAAGCLAAPLPSVINQRVVHHMVNSSDRHTERFYEIAFEGPPNERPTVMVVQLNDWGDGDVRVHADAFIDLFEDELGRFAKEPVKGARTFHVVADAYKHCFDETIPEPDKRSFIKLRTHPRMTPRLKAYFNRSSPMADEIAQPEALPWGSSGICTVTVQWNTEVAGKPFVELIKIDGFTWNP